MNSKAFPSMWAALAPWRRADIRTRAQAGCAETQASPAKRLLGAHRSRLGRWAIFAAVGGLAVILAAVAASEISRARALERLAGEAGAAASLRAVMLSTELERYRALPFVLARDPDVTQALLSQEPGDRIALSNKLSLLSAETNAYLLFIQDAAGVIISSSKWLEPESFINCQCGSDLYFDRALRTPSLEYFAKGRRVGRSGLYITHSVRSETGPLGVASVKIEFIALEEEWRKTKTTAFVIDKDGIVLTTSVPEWRFRTVAPLSPRARAEVFASDRFHGEPLEPIPGMQLPPSAGTSTMPVSLPGQAGQQEMLVARTPVGASGWSLVTLTPVAPIADAARITGGVIALPSGLLLLGIAGLLLRRSERRQAEILREARAREELESRVSARTSELTEANRRLVSEMEERRRIQGDVHRLQDELVQANKLATLGQIAAGVAHEINQPVAAIKTYAENTELLLQRGDRELVAQNLGVIGQLTGRISAITDELRAFSRRATGRTSRVRLSEAVEGALLLVSYRLTKSAVALSRRGEFRNVFVTAERARLEQILVNLLQNALDALDGRSDGRIEVCVEEQEDSVRLTVVDNGPGLSPETASSLFMPFATTKPQGLGLGLVISRDIAVELGGDLVALPVPSGASFMITLRKAA